METSIAIHESRKSDKVIKFVHSVSELLQFCSEKQAINLFDAAESGRLYGAYFTKSGKVKAQYNW